MSLAARARGRGSPVEPLPPAGEPDRRRARRGGRDRAQARERARARLSRASSSRSSSPPTARRDAHRRARARAAARDGRCACSICRGAARSPPRTPRSRSPGGEILAFSDANALWERGRARALVRRFADERVGYVCGAAALPGARTAANQEGAYWRYETAVRALESRLGSVTAGNGAIYAVRRERLPAARPAHQPRPLASVQPRQARLARRLRAARRAQRATAPDGRGRVPPQAPDDEPRLADRRARRDADPRGYGLALRARDLLAPRCFATRRRCCTSSRWERTWPSSADGGGLRLTLAAQLAVLGRRLALSRAHRRPRAPVRALPLLRARDRLARRRPLGLDLRSGTPDDLGARGGRREPEPSGADVPPDPRPRAARAAKRVLDLAARRRCCSLLSAPLLALACVAIRLESRGLADLPAAAGRQGGRAVRPLQAAHDGERRRAAWAPGSPSTRAIRGSRASAPCCGGFSLDELPNLRQRAARAR